MARFPLIGPSLERCPFLALCCNKELQPCSKARHQAKHENRLTVIRPPSAAPMVPKAD